MGNRRGFLLALLIFSSTAYAYGADEVNKGFTFNDSGAGLKIQIPGKFTDEGAREVQLVDASKPDVVMHHLPVELSGDPKNTLSFTLPNDLPSGRYFVKIKLGAADPLYVGELRVPTPEDAKVKLETVEPVSYYPDAQDRYGFVIAGTNFASALSNNHVEINKVPLLPLPECGEGVPRPCLKSEQGAETRLLIVEGYAPQSYSRPLQVGVRVGNGNNISAQVPVTFSRLSKTRLKLLATAAFFVLLLMLYILVRAGIKLGKIPGRFATLRAFLLDSETNSYSLSKFQLILFTLVAVFGYIYIFVCRLAVQWSFELPPVPEGLPSMAAVSLGTTVVAAAVGSNIGAKGAGPASPSFADFISSGGVVLPERFQFFLWTIVSSVGLLILVLASDPVTVKELPKLPDGMLYLIGLSSAGYLGGKLARGPGPSIKSVDVSKTPGTEKPGADGKVVKMWNLEAAVTGDNLSPQATFRLDNEPIPAVQVEVTEQKPDDKNPKLCSSFKIILRDVAERYFDDQHSLRIVNPDSQGAEVKYGATIDRVVVDQDKVTVTGTNFKDPSTAGWVPDEGAFKDLGVGAIHKTNDTELVVTLGPTITGKGKVKITSPGELSTTSIGLNIGPGSGSGPGTPPPTSPTEKKEGQGTGSGTETLPVPDAAKKKDEAAASQAVAPPATAAAETAENAEEVTASEPSPEPEPETPTDEATELDGKQEGD